VGRTRGSDAVGVDGALSFRTRESERCGGEALDIGPGR
jgi:hypothetical protein